MKKLLLALSTVLVTTFAAAQTTAPDATKPYLIFDATYDLQPVGAGNPTDVVIYYDNQTGTANKALQFRFWYDAGVFDAPTVTYTGAETNNYFQYNVNDTEGSVTVSWVYTGNDINFDIAGGSMFNVALPFDVGFNNGAISNMAFTGASSFPSYGTLADGTDTDLGLHNYGGVLQEPVFNYTATILNSGNNPAEAIPVILQKSADGTTWTDLQTVNTTATGQAVFEGNLDQSYWQIRVKINSGLDASSALSTADANMIAQLAIGLQTPTGIQYYTANPNQANSITAADSFTVFNRLAQNANSYPNNPDVLFFTEAQYTTILNATTNQSSTIPGLATFVSPLINNTTSGNYYMLILGDANGTGLN
jgi:hypothetical protein